MPHQPHPLEVITVYLALVLGTLLIISRLWGRWQQHRHKSPASTRTHQRTAQHTAGETTPPPTTRPVLAPWLTTLLDALHLLFIGHSRGGKTSVVHELAIRLAQQGCRVIVGDPDAAPGLWSGCEVFGYGDDFVAISEALTHVRAEVERRRELRGRGIQRRFEPLYLVLDEYRDVSQFCEEARPLVEDILRRGGKLDIHLMLGVQDKQVKTMGLEGQGDLRKNFTYTVEIRRDPQSGQRWATISDPNGDETPETHRVPQLPDLDALVEAGGAHASPAPDHRLQPVLDWLSERGQGNATVDHVLGVLQQHLHGAVRGTATARGAFSSDFPRTGTPVRAGTPHADAVSLRTADDDGAEGVPAGVPAVLTDEAIRTLYSAWGSKNKIAALLHGTKARRLERIDAALAGDELAQPAQATQFAPVSGGER
jgi:hypothetical protein